MKLCHFWMHGVKQVIITKDLHKIKATLSFPFFKRNDDIFFQITFQAFKQYGPAIR